MTIEQIAKVCHETNRAYCETIGDYSQKSWDEAEDWQKKSAIEGANFVLENPNVTEIAQHNIWMKSKEDDGWKYGPVKDVDRKEHPCMVPYTKLPIEQRVKDFLFRATVKAFVSSGVKIEK